MSEAERESDKLLGHSYDGIQEYDNPLPGWWKGIFFGCFLFAVGYFVYYHGGGSGQSELEAYEAEVAAHVAAQAKRGGPIKVTEAMLAGLSKNAQLMGSTKALYIAKCAQCHGQLGEGKIGPNLTDDHWIHGGGKLVGIYEVVRDGVPEKGMLAWGKLLKPNELLNVSAYVATLVGTKPPNPKPPQGTRVTQ